MHCFEIEFSELTGASSPQTSPGLYAEVSGRENLITVNPRHSTEYDTPMATEYKHLWPFPIFHNFGNV